MPDLTPRLGLKKPLGNENVTLASFNENYDILDAEVATKSDLDSHNNAAAAHGATPEATANRIVQRNAAGQFKVGAPTEANHVARKADLDEVKQSVSDGKTLVAGAITDKGVPTSPSDTFQRMAENIGAIETDKTVDATATAGDILTPKTAYAKGEKLTGTMPNRGVQTITPGASDKTIPDGYIAPGSKVVGDPDLLSGNIRAGKDIFGVVGNVIESTGDAAAGDVLAGKTFSKAGQAGITGTMPNHGAISQTITQQGGQYIIPAGYHSGSGRVTAQFSNLVPENVREGITIGGVNGKLRPAFPSPMIFMRGNSVVNPNPFVPGYVNSSNVTVTVTEHGGYGGMGIRISTSSTEYVNGSFTTDIPINLTNVNYVIFAINLTTGSGTFRQGRFYVGLSTIKPTTAPPRFEKSGFLYSSGQLEDISENIVMSTVELSGNYYITGQLTTDPGSGYAYVSGNVNFIAILTGNQ